MEILETERLRLRVLRPEDEEPFSRICGDPHVMRFYPQPWSAERAHGFIQFNIRLQSERGFSLWAVVHRETEQFIGFCGLIPQCVEGVEEIEVGYMLHPEFWGRGLAPEAARASRDHAFRQLGVGRVISLINPHNQPSIRVAEKNGMRLDRQTEFNGRPCLVYAVSRGDS